MNYPNNWHSINVYLSKIVGIGVIPIILVTSIPNISNQNPHCNFDCYQLYINEQLQQEPHNESQTPRPVQSERPRAAATTQVGL